MASTVCAALLLASHGLVAPATRLRGAGARIAINENFAGLRQVHAEPDVFVLEGFLPSADCDDMIERAASAGLSQSPVAYAGWTQDFAELFELAAKGPCAWLALLGAWKQVQGEPNASQIGLAIHTAQNYVPLLLLATAGVGLFIKSRTFGLQGLRTSSSTTLDTLGDGRCGQAAFVRQAARLFAGCDDPVDVARRFEAPTIIRYETGQVLAPHYDANRAALTEDAARGGQTLATLIVYLNDVRHGGLTRFCKLPEGSDEKLTVQPKRGDALLFFPADAAGEFDERTEHEGCAAIDEKYIARIWLHATRVPPPFGLPDAELAKLKPFWSP